MNTKFVYECINCGKQIVPKVVDYLCDKCAAENVANTPAKGILKTVYDYESIKTKLENPLFETLEQTEFIDLLPIKQIESMPFLRIGNTPMYSIYSLDAENLKFQLFLKDDSQNPTYSFKDRASALVSAYAKENQIDTISAASTGNAGSSLAGICAAQKQKAVIFAPAKAPKAKLTQILMYGADLVTVDGTYDDAFELCLKVSAEKNWYNRNTAYNPLTIEGKKTVSYEIFSQLNQQMPDYVFVPVGDGVILSGVYKGFEDLLKLDIINKMPKIVAVQSQGSSNLIDNMLTDIFAITPSNTIADSISVDIPRNFYMAKRYLLEYEGEWIKVSDNEILLASKILSKNTGIFSEPAATSSFAGMLKYKDLHKIPVNSKCVVMLTGSGLKDLNAVQSLIEIPKPVKPL